MNFKEWFANSVVVDNQGNPLPVYHFSINPGFDVFRKPKGFIGIHFGTLRAARARAQYVIEDIEYEGIRRKNIFTQQYLALRKTWKNRDTNEEDTEKVSKLVNACIYTCYLRITNPIIGTDNGDWSNICETYGSVDAQGNPVPRFADIPSLYASSFDGILYTNDVEDEGSTSYIVWDPSNIWIEKKPTLVS